MRLLPEVLGDHQASHVDRGLPVLVHAAHHELGTVDVVEGAPALGRASLEGLQGLIVVVGRHEVIEHGTVGNLAGEFHHLHSSCTDVDGDVLGPALLIHVVEFDAVEVHVFAVEGDVLVVKKRANDGHDFLHDS